MEDNYSVILFCGQAAIVRRLQKEKYCAERRLSWVRIESVLIVAGVGPAVMIAA